MTGKQRTVPPDGVHSPEDERVIYLAGLLKAIAHPARLCIVRKLYRNGRCNVGYFTSCMSISQSNVSQHLAKMRDLGIVQVERQGTEAYYTLIDGDVKQIIRVLFGEEEYE